MQWHSSQVSLKRSFKIQDHLHNWTTPTVDNIQYGISRDPEPVWTFKAFPADRNVNIHRKISSWRSNVTHLRLATSISSGMETFLNVQVCPSQMQKCWASNYTRPTGLWVLREAGFWLKHPHAPITPDCNFSPSQRRERGRPSGRGYRAPGCWVRQLSQEPQGREKRAAALGKPCKKSSLPKTQGWKESANEEHLSLDPRCTSRRSLGSGSRTPGLRVPAELASALNIHPPVRNAPTATDPWSFCV